MFFFFFFFTIYILITFFALNFRLKLNLIQKATKFPSIIIVIKINLSKYFERNRGSADLHMKNFFLLLSQVKFQLSRFIQPPIIYLTRMSIILCLSRVRKFRPDFI